MTKVMFVGDTHGDTQFLSKVGRLAKKAKVDYMLQVGDFGFAWDPKNPKLQAASNVLAHTGIPLYFICGNHENYDLLESLGAYEDNEGFTEVAPNIFHIPRGHHWVWGDTVFGALGGAASTDIQPDMFCRPPWKGRTLGVDWFSQENIRRSDWERAVDTAATYEQVHVFVTHDAPHPLAPVLQRHIERFRPDRLVDYPSIGNRKTIGAYVEQVKPWLNVHGHFHHSYAHLNGDTVVRGLGRDGMGSDAIMIVDLDDLQILISAQKRVFDQ